VRGNDAGVLMYFRLMMWSGDFWYWDRVGFDSLFLRCSRSLGHVTGFRHKVGHWRNQHQQTECYLLMLAVYRGDFRDNVGTVGIYEVGDHDDLDIGVELSCKRNLPHLRVGEAGSSNDS
jgi:hypothetical protein